MSLEPAEPLSPPLATPTRWSRGDLALLAVVLFVAAFLRIAALDRLVSFDELWHLALSTGRGSPVGQIVPDRIYVDPPDMTALAGAPPFWHVWNHMDGVLHPPLYVITLRLWRDAFGPSEAAAMSYSIAWSLVAIGVTFATVRLLSDRYAAMLIALAMAVARTQAYFALAVRGYEMLIGLGAIAIWLMVRIDRLGPTRRRAVALAAMTLPLLLTHYFAAGAVAAIAVYGLWRSRGHRIAFLTTLAASGLIYAAVWMPFALRQLDDVYTGDAFLRLDRFDAGLEAVAIFGAPMRLVVESTQTLTLAGIVGLIGAIVLVATGANRQRARSALPMVLWLIGSLGCIAALDAIRLTGHAFFIRYLAVATPAAYVAVVSVGAGFGRWGAIVGGGALLIVALAVRPAGPIVVEKAPDYSQTARWLAVHASPDEALLLYHGASAREVGDMLFVHIAHDPGPVLRPVMKVERPLAPATIAGLPRRAWIVIPYPAEGLLVTMFQNPRLIERRAMPDNPAGEMFHVEWPR